MKIERTKNATRNITFEFMLRIYRIAVPFVMRTVMIYILGVEYLGLNYLFTSILEVLNLAELGIGSAMIYSMYKPIAEDDEVTICGLMKLYKIYYRVIGGVVFIVGLILLPFIPKLITGEIPQDINIYILYLLNLSGTVLSYWLFAYKNSILLAHQRVDMISKVTIATDTFKYIMQLGVLFLFGNYYYFVMMILISQILTNVATAIVSDRMYPKYKAVGKLPKHVVKSINRRIRDLFTAKLGGTIVNSADTIVISAFLGLTSLAIYQNYYFIMKSVIWFMMIIFNACTAGIGNSIVTESKEKNYNDFVKFTFFTFWISGIFACCLLCLYQPFMRLWMGDNLLLPLGCVVLFCVYFYLFTTNSLFCTYKDAAGIWHEDRFRPLVGAMVNLFINLILVKKMGIYAILLSTVLSYIFVAMPWLIHNLFGVIFKRSFFKYVINLLKYTIVIVIASIVSYLLCLLIPDTKIISLFLKAAVSFLISNIIFWLIFHRRKEFDEMLNLLENISKHKMDKLFEKFRYKGDV